MPRPKKNSEEMAAIREARRQHLERLESLRPQGVLPQSQESTEQSSTSETASPEGSEGGASVNDMTREEMVAVLRALGKRVPHNISDERLRERVERISYGA